jgi:hypothetical protein
MLFAHAIISLCIHFLAVPWVRQLFAGFQLWRSGINPGPLHLGFVVDEVALRWVFLEVLLLYPVKTAPPVPPAYSFVMYIIYNLSSGQCH